MQQTGALTVADAVFPSTGARQRNLLLHVARSVAPRMTTRER
jgi:hypothetical protein